MQYMGIVEMTSEERKAARSGGQKLREAIRAAGHSIRGAAEAWNIPWGTLNGWAYGTRRPCGKYLAILEAQTGLTARDFHP